MKRKHKTIQKSDITIKKEFRRMQIIICNVILYDQFLEFIILTFQCTYLILLNYLEYIAILVIVLIILILISKQFRWFRSTLTKIQGLLKQESICSTCKTLLFCEICHNCNHNSNYNHYIILQLCLQELQIRHLARLIVLFIIKILVSICYEIYTQILNNNTLLLHHLILICIICNLFSNGIQLIFTFIFCVKFYQEKIDKYKYENQKINTPVDGFVMIDKIIDQINNDQPTDQKQEHKKPTPDVDHKESINLSINDHISPAQQNLKSSLTPSPGKYRSGKILDFLEKKISHARISHKELSGIYSKEFTKKYNTDQIQQSIDFGDENNDSDRTKNQIELQLQQHNFLQQVKFFDN